MPALIAENAHPSNGAAVLPVGETLRTAMPDLRSRSAKAVVVHGGSRDAYQLALALSEAGLLEALVTDLFWKEDRGWAKKLSERLPARLLATLRQRSVRGLTPDKVQTCPLAGIGGLLLDRLPRIPFSIRRRWIRSADAALGRAAGRRAKRTSAGLVSYSYFGYDAFREYGRGGMLFQVHPHPATMRRILREELDRHPECAASLQKEWELALPEDDFQHLVGETSMASCYLAASTFTCESLIEHGASKDSISVVPYGVDLKRFRPGTERQPTSKLRLLFVGRINQRKGVKYLIEALRLLDSREVELVVCGRVLDEIDIFRPFASQVQIRPSVSTDDLVRAYQSADLFVFPSVGEGFGQVLLESLASGLPILSTTHTAAPDLIEDGVQGFIVEPRRPELLAERIDWALTHRSELATMRSRARQRAEHFTWQRFRTAAAEAVQTFLAEQDQPAESGVLRV